ncbi:MAG: MATE family efflux transporter [Oscillospiraceae bacterium]|jgi:putative MATE family efflux protein
MDSTQIKTNKYLIKITIPVFIEILLGTLIGMIDQYMISTRSESAYNAIGQSNQIINVFVITFNVVAMASTILISQNNGAHNIENSKRLYSLSVFVNVIFGVVVSVLLVFFNAPIFRWMNFTGDIFKDATVYITIIGGGMFLHSLALTYSAFFKANGLMKESRYVTIIMNVVNVIGNALLIFGWFGLPELGIMGVAIASNISKLVGVLLFVWLYKKQIGIKISFKELRPFPFSSLKKMLGIGVPSAGESLSFNFAMVVIQKNVNKIALKTGQALIITAKTTVNLLYFISWIFAAAISSTTQVIVGYMMGAGDIASIQKRYTSSRSIAMLLSFVGSLTLYLLAEPICSLFVSDPAVIAICKKILFIDIFLEQGRAVNMVTVRSLQACGDTKFPIVLGIIDAWIVAVLGGFVLGDIMGFGIYGVWCGMAADEILRGVFFTIRWKRGKWQKMRLVG